MAGLLPRLFLKFEVQYRLLCLLFNAEWLGELL
jgi:hypothetical protein